MPVLEFDATINLFRHHVVLSPFCGDPEAAVVAVREAVERMPGAFWISVAYVGKGPAYLHDAEPFETLYRRCNANPPDGPEGTRPAGGRGGQGCAFWMIGSDC